MNAWTSPRKFIIFFILGILFILFHSIFITWFDSLVVEKFLSRIETSLWSYFFMFLLIEATVFFLLLSIQQNVLVRDEWAILSLMLLSLYIYFRFFSRHYCFLYYPEIPQFKYADYFILLFGVFPSIKISNYFTENKSPIFLTQPFLVDLPIESSEKDHFRRKEFASLLAKKITSKFGEKNPGSLAIGINGLWGSGKTSFANLVKEEINQSNRLIIDFNPWRSSNPNKVIEDFFELMIAKLRPYDSELSHNLAVYAKTLIKIDENNITRVMEIVSSYFFPDPDKNQIYEMINRSIVKTKKQVIVFIDDLDRLDKKEIIEVLRIIRNTANFDNFVYVALYDKSYVLEAIKEFNPHNYQYFLEKIFQFEFLLPNCEPVTIRTKMKDFFRSALHSNFHDMIESAIEYRSMNGKNITERFISTQRDVQRCANNLLFEIESVMNNVNFIDFYFIQLLKIKYTSIYAFLSDYRQLLFINEDKKLRLRRFDEKNISPNDIELNSLFTENKKPENQSETLLNFYLKQNVIEILPEIEREAILDLVDELLKEKTSNLVMKSGDPKSFSNKLNYDFYFNIQVLESDFPYDKLDSLKTTAYKEFEIFVLQLMKEGKPSEVVDYLEKTLDFSNKKDWANHVTTMLDVLKTQYNLSGRHSVNYRYFIDLLNYPESRGNPLLLNLDPDEYGKFVRGIFVGALEPYLIESTILLASISSSFQIANFKGDEARNRMFRYFDKYCQNHFEIDSNFRQLYDNIKGSAFELDAPDLAKSATELFINHFKKYLKASELNGFIQQFEPRSDKYKISADWVKTFFLQWDDFERYLLDAENLKNEPNHLNEFLEFFYECKKKSYAPVPFNFQYLNPSGYG